MRRLAEAVLVAALAVSAVALGISLLRSDDPDCGSFRLDRAAWIAREPGTGGTELAKDLVECRVLVGMTDRQARALLGPPDASHRDGWRYDLGAERSMFERDRESLTVRVARGRVTGAEIDSD